MSPAFSVIVPVHNKAPHVPRSISSVLNQTFQDFELIVIDDASTDGSSKEISKFKDERIRSYKRENPGAGGYAARNFGIKKAKGEWIAFLDADDKWKSFFLEELHVLIKQFPTAGLLCTGYKIVHNDGHSSYNPYYQKNKNAKKHLFDITDFLRGPRPPWTSATAVQKKLLREVNGFDENWNHGADTDLWLRVLLTGTDGAWSPKIGAIYYKDSVNMVTDSRTQEKSPCSETIKKFLTKNSNHPNKVHLKRFSNKMYRQPFIRRANNGGFNLWEVLRNFYLSKPSRMVMVFTIASLLPVRLQQRLVNKFK